MYFTIFLFLAQFRDRPLVNIHAAARFHFQGYPCGGHRRTAEKIEAQQRKFRSPLGQCAFYIYRLLQLVAGHSSMCFAILEQDCCCVTQ